MHNFPELIFRCWCLIRNCRALPVESWAFSEPVRMIVFVPLAAVAWYVPRHIRQNAMDVEKELIFEEAPTQTIEVLRLED